VRPIYSEPQNIVLSGQVRSSQRKAIYQQLGGDQACHEAEVMLNSLVCLASQFSKELACVEGFLPIREPGAPAAASEAAGEGQLVPVTSVKNPAIQKLAKQQLFKGGIANAQLLVSGPRGGPAAAGVASASRPGAGSALNYHDLILQELKMQQEVLAGQHARRGRAPPPGCSSPLEERASQARGAGPSVLSGAAGDPGLEESRALAHFLPDPELWTLSVRDLLTVEQGVEQPSAPQSPLEAGATESPKARRTFRLVPSQLLDKVYAKIRELVQYPIVVRQRFFLASAKKHQPAWYDLEKLMVVALLYHSQSLHLARKFAEIKVPNLKSSGGVFQYGTGLKSGLLSDEGRFLIDQLKLIGHQLNDLLMWLILRVQGEMDAQQIIASAFEATQQMIDARLERKAAEELEQQRQELEQERLREEERSRAAVLQAEAEAAELKKAEQSAKEGKLGPACPSEAAPEVPAKGRKVVSEAVLVTGSKNRRMKRGKIVRSALDTSKAKQPAKQKKAPEVPQESDEASKQDQGG